MNPSFIIFILPDKAMTGWRRPIVAKARIRLPATSPGWFVRYFKPVAASPAGLFLFGLTKHSASALQHPPRAALLAEFVFIPLISWQKNFRIAAI